MKWIEYREVPISSLGVDEQDIDRRKLEPHVAALAESFTEATGGEPGNAPWVTPALEVVAGRDRIAAALLLDLATITVRIGEFTARDVILATAHENLRRRHDDRSALLAKLTAELAAEIAAERKYRTDVPLSPGRPVTPIGEARAQIAKASGATVESVRKAEQRSTQKAAAESPPPASPPPIREFGVGVDPLLAAQVWEIQEDVDIVANALQAAQAALSRGMEAAEGLGERAEHQRLYDQLHAQAVRVRARRPEALCPWGKGQCTDACLFCRGARYATAAQMAMDIPSELLCEGAEAMVGDGRGGFEKFARGAQGDSARHGETARTAKAGPSPAPPKRNGRHISVQLDDGRVVDPAAPPADLIQGMGPADEDWLPCVDPEDAA